MAGPANFNTADRIIRLAMRDAGILQKGDDPDPEDYAENMVRLNDIVNSLQIKGLKLWLNNLVNVTLIAGQSTYILGPGGFQTARSMRILEAYYFPLGATSYPLTALSWKEYNLLGSVSQPGQPNSYFVDKQQLTTRLILWLVPDTAAATGFVQILQQSPVANLVNITDTMNFPQEWFIALHWALAEDMSTGQPKEIIDRCTMKAGMYLAALEDWDVEDAATSFAPDGKGQGGSRFGR